MCWRLNQFYAAMRDGEHDAVFCAVERDGVMRRARFVDDVRARAVLALLISIAALKDEDFFDPDMSMSRIATPRSHAYQDGRISRPLVTPQEVNNYPVVPGRAPFD